MSNLPDKVSIPKDRIPKPFSQNIYKNGRLYNTVNSCVTCSIVKVIESLYAIKNGYYTELSKGYAYVRHSGRSDSGTAIEIVLKSMAEKKTGSVPYDMCTDYTEKPEICEIIENRHDLAELDKEAEKWAIENWECVECNKENIKKYIDTYNVPLVGRLKRSGNINHCVVITGYDDKYIYYHDHTVSGNEERAKYDRWLNSFYYITIPDGGVKEKTTEEQEETEVEYKLMEVKDFKAYLDSLKINRKITTVQLHHTYSPSYAQFNGHNHIALQKGMRDYHVNTKGWNDIAQQFTIFPDGKICTGRNINTVPAGIYGANSTGICIECLGNFDKGGDVMTEAQKNAIVTVTKILLDKFSLLPERNVTYHAWWTSSGESLGDYVKGRSAKTCPGTNFFGGNTKDAYKKNLMPLIENYGKEEKVMLETGNDIVWELMNGKHKVEITEVERAIKAIDKAKKNAEFSSLYWILYKLVNNR